MEWDFAKPPPRVQAASANLDGAFLFGNERIVASRQLLLEQQLGKGQSRVERSVPISRLVSRNLGAKPATVYLIEAHEHS